MDIDWSFIIAAYGAGLATILAIAGLVRWVRAKPAERESEAWSIFRAIVGPLTSLEKGMANQYPIPAVQSFLDTFVNYKDDILGVKSVLSKVAPEISPDLVKLVEIFDSGTMGTWRVTTSGDAYFSDPNLKPLVTSLKERIEKWLHDRA